MFLIKQSHVRTVLSCTNCVIFAGFVTWKEFHIHFLLAKGYKQNETLQHVEDYDSLPIDSEGPYFCCSCVL